MDRELRRTADGSHTMFVPQLNEHYHSIHGAIQESRHIFIDAGLLATQKSSLHILEYGMGTGLNVWLTAIYAHQFGLSVSYTALEKYPLTQKEYEELNYTQEHKQHENLFLNIHESSWEGKHRITEQLELQKIQCDFREFVPDSGFDLIYFDAFGPEIQPGLWSEAVFRKAFQGLVPGGFLITYSAKGQVKRNLKAAGFTVVPLPGPPGKRQITKALKPL